MLLWRPYLRSTQEMLPLGGKIDIKIQMGIGTISSEVQHAYIGGAP